MSTTTPEALSRKWAHDSAPAPHDETEAYKRFNAVFASVGMVAYIFSFFLVLFASGVRANDDLGQVNRHFLFPVLKVENPEFRDAVKSIITVFQILSDSDGEEVPNSTDISLTNFVFSSGKNFIVDRRITLDAIPFTNEEIINAILLKDADDLYNEDSSDCNFMEIQLTNSKIYFVVSNNVDNKISGTLACLVYGLWFYRFGSVDGIDGIDWRYVFSVLISNFR